MTRFAPSPCQLVQAPQTDRTIEDAYRCLHDSGYVALRSIKCEMRGDHLTLSGRVSSFYLKQVAQEKVAALPRIKGVTNEIEVLE